MLKKTEKITNNSLYKNDWKGKSFKKIFFFSGTISIKCVYIVDDQVLQYPQGEINLCLSKGFILNVLMFILLLFKNSAIHICKKNALHNLMNVNFQYPKWLTNFFVWFYVAPNTVNVIWWLSSFAGRGRPWVSLFVHYIRHEVAPE